ncbi:PH domain-containing protein [Neomicrococcus lactis]
MSIESQEQYESPWHRVHPISPFVRGWVVVVGAIYIYSQNILSSALEGNLKGNVFELPSEVLWPIMGIAFGIIALLLVGFYLSWRFTQYQITDDHVRTRSGILFRQHRQARIDRVQAIDIVQPLLARIFGLAELKFEVADSGQSAMNLSYLKYSDAQTLRNTILARAAGLRTTAPHPSGTDDAQETQAASPSSSNSVETAEAPEIVVATTPPGRLIGSSILNPTLLVVALAFLIPVVIGGVLLETPATYVGLLPGLLSVGAIVWNELNKGFGFTASASPDGLRLKYGLTETSHQTIPPGRIQAVRVHAPLLWRPFGWYRVVANVAGYGEESGEQRSMLLRVGKLEDVYAVLPIVLPDPGTDRPLDLLTDGLKDSTDQTGFTQTPRSAAWLSPLAFKRQGYASTSTSIVIRGGRLSRHLTYVPHERTQGVLMHQGPIARRAGVADVELASTSGQIHPRVKQMSVAEARSLFLMQADRAATARRLHDRNHWLVAEQNAQISPASPSPQSSQEQPHE